MAFAIRHIDHVVLKVADVERSLAFYRDVLGCTLARRNPEKGIVHLRAGTSMLDLVAREGAAGPGANMDHVAFRIEPFDPAAIAAHLAAHGIACGPVVPRFGAEGSGPSIYLADPDGNGVELKGPPA